MKVVIIGGVAGGASTATRLRRNDEEAEIVLLERGEYISFANCGMPYHIGGVIKDRQKLLVVTPQTLKDTFNIDARTQQEALAIDRSKKLVKVKNLKNGNTYEEKYDKLVLSPGAAPIIPSVEGVNLEGVFSLRSLSDMDKIKDIIVEKHPKQAVVVGGGFIGLEIAENLHKQGLQVTLVEMLNQVMAPIDYEMAAMVHQHLQFKNIRLSLGDGLKSIHKDNVLKITLQSGAEVKSDLVILSVGVHPENSLAKDAGLELGVRGTIVTNEFMQTSDQDIYAIGDATQVIQLVSGKPTSLPLAGPASKQARIVADHLTGKNVQYSGVLGTSIVKVFDLTVASTGLNSHQLKELGLPFKNAIIHASNHAGYYPGASPMAFKLLFSPEGQIYGAQLVGLEGVDKRIDVVATAMYSGLKVFDLEKLELAYAPPYGSARDAVNLIGFVAGNMLRGDLSTIDWDEVKDVQPEKDYILDVREPEELTLGSLPNSHNIPLGQLRQRMGEIPKDKRIIVYCQVGQRGYFACRTLQLNGYHAVNLNGGYKTYSHAVSQQSNFDTFENVTITSREEIQETVPFMNPSTNIINVDACGLQCPGPILKLQNAIKEMKPGEVAIITATDFGFTSDVKAWASRTGNQVLSVTTDNNIITAQVQKGATKIQASSEATNKQDKTMVIFSGELDKALAAFIIANGAAAMGHKVTMFFTFWGLNILRKNNPPAVKKTLIERMFAWMMPRGADKLSISKMNMGGMGTALIKSIMKKKNIYSLPVLIKTAQENGVIIQACQMSMDMMGIKKEELLDGIEVVGVATFVASSDESNATLFI